MERPLERLRAALQRDGSANRGPAPLAGVTSAEFRSWAKQQGLQVHRVAGAATDPGVYAEGTHALGQVRGRCVVDGDTAAATGVDLAVTSDHPAAPPDLAAFLLDPLAATLREPRRSAIDTWLRGQLNHRAPYNAATTLDELQLAVAIDDANPAGRTWSLTVRGH